MSDSAFQVTIFTNPYMFHVYRNSAQSAGNSAFAKVNFDSEVYDTGNNFDSATNFRFTAPVAGFYQFNWVIGVAVSGGSVDSVSSLYKNGSTFAWGTEAPNATGSQGSAIIKAAANDYFEIFMYTSNGQSLSVGSSPYKTYFSGFLVSTT